MNFKILILLSFCILYSFAGEYRKNKQTISNVNAERRHKSNDNHHRKNDHFRRKDDHRRNDEKWLIEKSKNRIEYCNNFHEKYTKCKKIFLQNRCSKFYNEYTRCLQII